MICSNDLLGLFALSERGDLLLPLDEQFIDPPHPHDLVPISVVHHPGQG